MRVSNNEWTCTKSTRAGYLSRRYPALESAVYPSEKGSYLLAEQPSLERANVVTDTTSETIKLGNKPSTTQARGEKQETSSTTEGYHVDGKAQKKSFGSDEREDMGRAQEFTRKSKNRSALEELGTDDLKANSQPMEASMPKGPQYSTSATARESNTTFPSSLCSLIPSMQTGCIEVIRSRRISAEPTKMAYNETPQQADPKVDGAQTDFQLGKRTRNIRSTNHTLGGSGSGHKHQRETAHDGGQHGSENKRTREERAGNWEGSLCLPLQRFWTNIVRIYNRDLCAKW